MHTLTPIDPVTLFRGFAGGPAAPGAPDGLRARITQAYRLPEPAAVAVQAAATAAVPAAASAQVHHAAAAAWAVPSARAAQAVASSASRSAQSARNLSR